MVTPTDTEPVQAPAETPPPAATPSEAVAIRDIETQLEELANVPGRDEFLALAQMARVMATSGIVPRSLQGKPADVLVVLLTGRDLGIPITAAVRKVYVIDGQPSVAPQLKAGLARQKGLGSIIPAVATDTVATAVAVLPHGVLDGRCKELATTAGAWPLHWSGPNGEPCGCMGHVGYYTVTWEDAVEAGLVRGDCRPGAHSTECRVARAKDGVRQTGANGANFCKDNWRKYPRRQLGWRAAGYCADDYFPEATLGLYTPDDLGALTDEDGKPIDVSSVQLPDGYGTGPGGITTSRDRAAAGDTSGPAGDDVRISPDDAWALQERVLALPDDGKQAFKERWVNMVKLKGWVLRDHPASLTGLVESMLRGVEGQFKARGGWEPAAALEAARADIGVVLGGVVLAIVTGAWPGAEVEPAAPAEPGPAPGSPQDAPDSTPAATTPEPAQTPGHGHEGGGEQTLGVDPELAPPADEADTLAQVIEEVRAMSLGEVKQALVARELSARGQEPTIRLTLARTLAGERGIAVD